APAVTADGPRGDAPALGDGARSARDATRDAIRGAIPDALRDATRETVRTAREAVRDLGQERVVTPPDLAAPFAARWSWAETTAAGAGEREYWIGYRAPTVALAGRTIVSDSEPWSSGELGRSPLAEVLPLQGRSDGVVMLFRVRDRDRGSPGIERVSVRSPSVGMRFDGGTVYWLGDVAAASSFRWLRDLYDTLPDTELRSTLLEGIGVHRGTEPERFLHAVAADGGTDDELREDAIEALEYHPSDASVDLLARAARRDRSTAVRQEAAETLGDIAHPRAGAALRALVLEGEDEEMRREAVEALGQQREPDLARLLFEVARNDPSREVRHEAVEALAELGAPEAASLLERLALESQDKGVRGEAVDALTELPPNTALGILSRLAFESRHEDVRREAAETLVDLPHESALPALVRLAWDSPDSDVRKEAVESLAQLGGAAALAELDRIVANHAEESVVRQAVESIGEFPSTQAVPRLERILLSHPMVSARREALDALEQHIEEGR
ncbi:MAG: HEAT repeat domain-containing protein, partial [Longimicrobiales bacterium]